jgi:hypothetical protein
MNETSTGNTQSFNEEFCLHLEGHLCDTFRNSEREDLKGFWCDGVAAWFPEPDIQYAKKYVNDHRKFVTTAWIGKTGQDEYEVTVQFGKYSLRRYAKGRSLIDCLPSDETMDWIDIDTMKKTIELRLK